MDIESAAKEARQRFLSASKMVEETVRQAILNGALPSGRKLNQLNLAKAFGVSRVPVREALRTLEAEGLIVFSPHRGAVVAPLSIEEVEELYAMRIGLEEMAARLGARHMTSGGLERMEHALQRMQAAARREDLGGVLEADLDFHTAHYLASGRTRLWERILQLRRMSQRYIHEFWRLPQSIDRTIASHTKILDACKRRNGDGAAALIRQDLEDTANDLLTWFRESQPSYSVSQA